MESGKLELTLFDVLAYLLPGYVLIFAGSLFEATFLGTQLLALNRLGNSFLFVAIAAYFVGHLCHSTGSLIKAKFFPHLGEEDRLRSPIYRRFKSLVLSVYKIGRKESTQMTSLDYYILADNFIVVNGASDERSSLQIREGFHKSSAVAFGILFIVVFASLFVGGLRIQIMGGAIQTLGVIGTWSTIAISLIFFLLFVNRFVFYNRMKLSNTYALFLACLQSAGAKYK